MAICCATATSPGRNTSKSQQKLERAEIAQEMEKRKQGEMLEMLDPASLPISPTEPKRPLVISIGAGLGLFWVW